MHESEATVKEAKINERLPVLPNLQSLDEEAIRQLCRELHGNLILFLFINQSSRTIRSKHSTFTVSQTDDNHSQILNLKVQLGSTKRSIERSRFALYE